MELNILIVLAAFFGFILLHETGHYVYARISRLEGIKVGFVLSPLPHPCIIVSDTRTKINRVIFLIAGIVFNMVIAGLLYLLGAFEIKELQISYCIHFLLETNPFYSDLTQVFRKLDQDKVAFHEQKYKDSAKKNKRNVPHANGRKDLDKWHEQLRTNPYFDKYKFSAVWYLHLFTWGAIAVMFFSK